MSTLTEIEAAVDQLPQADKVRLMETLWGELSREERWESPAWHGDLLVETEKRLAEGHEETLDWEEVKRQLRGRKP